MNYASFSRRAVPRMNFTTSLRRSRPVVSSLLSHRCQFQTQRSYARGSHPSTPWSTTKRSFSETTAPTEMQEEPREAMAFDVLIVGGGPAGLAAAIRFKQLCQQQDKDLSVCLIDKGSEIGMRTGPWRGARLDGILLIHLRHCQFKMIHMYHHC